MEMTRIVRASRLGRRAVPGEDGGTEAPRRVQAGAVPVKDEGTEALRRVQALCLERQAVPVEGGGTEATRIVRASRLGMHAEPVEGGGMEAARNVRAARLERQAVPMEGGGEDATRIVRASRRDRPAASAEGAREPSSPPPREPLPLERFALVTWVLGRERAAELLDGLEDADAERAKEHLRRLAAMPSAQRQAKVAVEFGERSDAAARLRALMEEVPEPLRKALFRYLPPYHRTLFSGRQVEAPGPDAPLALEALAERLIREATR